MQTTTTAPQPLTKNQLMAFNALLHRLSLAHHKAAMVSGATNGRTESSKELYSNEARDLIKELNQQQLRTDINADKISKMCGKIMYYAHEMRWVKTNPAGKTVADGKRIDEWMIKFSYLKKKLNSYKYAELPKLVSQFQMLYKAFLKNV